MRNVKTTPLKHVSQTPRLPRARGGPRDCPGAYLAALWGGEESRNDGLSLGAEAGAANPSARPKA